MELHRRLVFLSFATVALAAGSWPAGCAGQPETSSSSSSGSSGTGGQGGTTSSGGGEGGSTSSGTGGSASPCAVDCTQIQAPMCQVAQCNTQSGQCEVVAEDDGTACDDSVFCTVSDTCVAGVCVGGPDNDCGITASACEEVTCDEQTQSCSTQALANGSPCTPTDLCQENATCTNGLCSGTTKDCFMQPVPDDCHVSECNPQNGQCEPVVGNEGGPCNDANDLCTVNKTCTAGACVGGDPKNCSHLTVDCNLGVCDTNTGQCVTQAVGNGQPCDDLDPCTTGETCSNSVCSNGTAVTTCQGGDYCCPSNCNENNDIDCASCDWIPTVFPISWNSSNSVGDMTFDQNCNLYWSAGAGEVFKVPHNTNQVQTLHSFGTYARGIAHNPNDNLLYVATSNGIFSMTTTGQNTTLVPGSNISTHFGGMTVAPGGWGSYGGHLVVAHSTGAIYAVNPAGGTPAVIGSQSGYGTDAEFDYSTGTLYVSYYANNGVFTLSPSGQLTPFANGLNCEVDGIAIDEGQTVFAACGGNDTLHKLTMPGGAATQFSSATLNGGWAPAGLIYDGLDNLIVMEDGEFLKVYTP